MSLSSVGFDWMEGGRKSPKRHDETALHSTAFLLSLPPHLLQEMAQLVGPFVGPCVAVREAQAFKYLIYLFNN